MTAFDTMMNSVTWRKLELQGPRDDGIPRATHAGEMQLFGITLRCFRLEDGRAIIASEDIEALMSSEACRTACSDFTIKPRGDRNRQCAPIPPSAESDATRAGP